MEWKTNILRKVVVIDESKTEISEERYTIHRKKLELINTSIEETGISICRMAGERNPCANETFSRDLGMNISYLQSAETLASDEDFDRLHTVNSNGENMETGDNSRRPQSTDESTSFDENSSFLVSELDNSTNCNENNDNIVPEKYELDYVNEDKENDVEDVGNSLQTAGTLENFNENLDFSDVSKLSNFQNHIENNNQTNKGTGNMGHNEIFKNPATSLKNFKTKQTFKSNNLSRKKKNDCTNDTLTGINMEMKFDNPQTDDAYGMLFTNKPSNENNMTEYGSEINIISKSDASRMAVPSEYMTTRNDADDSKRTEVVMKDFRNEKDPLLKQNDIKNNMKKYDSSITHFENGMRRKLGKETVSRSVTDLVTYFESLNTLKESNVKSKMKKFESKQGLKRDRIIKVNRISNSNSSSSPTTLRISKTDPETTKVKRCVPDDILSEANSDNTKISVAKQSDVILHHMISGDRKGKMLGDRKRPIDEKSPEGSVFDLNTGVRKKSIQTIPENIPFDFNIQRCGNMESSTDKQGICAYCGGQCEHCEQATNYTEDNANKIKEHVFVFSDDVPKRTPPSSNSNPRRVRTRFTRKHDSVYQQSLKELGSSKKDVKSTSDFNKTEESGSPFIGNPIETAEKICSDCSANTSIQNSIIVTHKKAQRKEKHGKNLSDKNKLKSSSTSVGSSKVKHFIGILLTAVIIAIIHKGILENYSFN